jgi:hypothetical protein
MHALARRPSATHCLRVAVAVVIVALAAGWGATVARGDGDPASDVLVSQSVFWPWDVSRAGLPELEGVLNAAAKAGFPVRVALIGSPTDLGTVSSLWREPANYAGYLGEELSFVYRGQVLVVMPDGFGLYVSGQLPSAERAAVATLPAPGDRAHLIAAATAAVRRLAQSAGHPVAGTIAAAGNPSSQTATGGASASLIAFLAGLILIALAWIASLRARPLQLRRSSVR